MAKKKQSKGLGDLIDDFTTKTKIKSIVKLINKDCGCDERKEFLNELVPFKLKVKECFTSKQYEWYKSYYNNRTLKLVNTQTQLDNIVSIHEHVFKWKTLNLCYNCPSSATVIRNMIKRLDRVYLSYNQKQ